MRIELLRRRGKHHSINWCDVTKSMIGKSDLQIWFYCVTLTICAAIVLRRHSICESSQTQVDTDRGERLSRCIKKKLSAAVCALPP
jgi:hypothetical protein